MDNAVLTIINNATLLVALAIVYELGYSLPASLKRFEEFGRGLAIGLLGVAVMYLPFWVVPGVQIDARSILMGVTGLFMGPVTTLIAAVITSAFRLYRAGAGMITGLLVIWVSGGLGLIWRRVRGGAHLSTQEYFAFGVALHVAMVLALLTLPAGVRFEVIRVTVLPVMIVYPPVTTMLGVLMSQRRERNYLVELLRESEERYANLFHNTHTMMMVVDPKDGRILEANPAARQFYGWESADSEDLTVYDISTLTKEQIDAEIDRARRTQKAYFNFRHLRADGSTADVEVHSSPVPWDGRQALLSVIHDVTPRMRYQRALQESERRFRSLVWGAPDAIFVQTGGRFVFVNDAAMQLFGAEEPEDLLGNSVIERMHPDYRNVVEERIRRLNEQSIAAPALEEVYLRLDGTPVPVEVSAVPTRYGGEPGAVVFVRDVSERKRLERTQRKMQTRLIQQQKMESIGTLAGGVAHEINSPINGIMNYAQLLHDAMPKDDPDRQYAKEIMSEAERVAKITSSLLQFSRTEYEASSPARVVDIVSNTLLLIRTIVRRDQIELDVDVPDNLPRVRCRSQQIQQVLMNLVTNSRDALNERYPGCHENKIIHIWARSAESHGRAHVRVFVKDYGGGIPAEVRDRIFEPFFTTKERERGTGLGLAISYGIIADHGENLDFETSTGSHTIFHFDLPVAEEEAIPSGKEDKHDD
ncbi:MAG: PAS domain S-box protein [Bacillota bacterium]